MHIRNQPSWPSRQPSGPQLWRLLCPPLHSRMQHPPALAHKHRIACRVVAPQIQMAPMAAARWIRAMARIMVRAAPAAAAPETAPAHPAAAQAAVRAAPAAVAPAVAPAAAPADRVVVVQAADPVAKTGLGEKASVLGGSSQASAQDANRPLS